MLKHNKNGLYSCICCNISTSLLITQHSKFEIIDVIRHKCCKLIDFSISNKFIKFILNDTIDYVVNGAKNRFLITGKGTSASTVCPFEPLRPLGCSWFCCSRRPRSMYFVNSEYSLLVSETL